MKNLMPFSEFVSEERKEKVPGYKKPAKGFSYETKEKKHPKKKKKEGLVSRIIDAF
jgi:hypothetical protein